MIKQDILQQKTEFAPLPGLYKTMYSILESEVDSFKEPFLYEINHLREIFIKESQDHENQINFLQNQINICNEDFIYYKENEVTVDKRIESLESVVGFRFVYDWSY